MIKKKFTVLSAVCFLVAAILFFAVVKNVVLGICFSALGVSALIRAFVINKNNDGK